MKKRKPPLGLVPKYVQDSNRAIAIVEAMQRYQKAGKPIPLEWAQELYDLVRDRQENPPTMFDTYAQVDPALGEVMEEVKETFKEHIVDPPEQYGRNPMLDSVRDVCNQCNSSFPVGTPCPKCYARNR